MRTKTIVVDAMAARQGGGQTYLHNLFKYVPDAGHSVRVIAVVPHVDVFCGSDRVEYITPSFSAGNLAARLLWTKTRLPALLRSVRAAVLFCPGGSVAAFGNGLENRCHVSQHVAVRHQRTPTFPLRLHACSPGRPSIHSGKVVRKGEPGDLLVGVCAVCN